MIPVLSIIKHCKKQGILNPADLEKLMETNTSIPIRQIFKIGITSGDFMLRQTTLGSLCETRSLSEKLTNFEEDLLKTFLRYCIRDSLGPQGKHEIGALLQKLMVRYKSNLRQQVSTLSYQDSSKLPELYDEFLNFINESCNQIGVCFYPGCPSSKMFLAIYLYNQLFLDIWSYDTIDEIPVKTKRKPDRTGVNPKDFIPMETLSKLSIYESHNLESLFSCIWDSFEKTRELVFDTIRKFPSPLPNIPFDKFRYYLDSAKALICSSRARNGDTGALIIRIVCSQYLQNSSIACDDSFYVIGLTCSLVLVFVANLDLLGLWLGISLAVFSSMIMLGIYFKFGMNWEILIEEASKRVSENNNDENNEEEEIIEMEAFLEDYDDL